MFGKCHRREYKISAGYLADIAFSYADFIDKESLLFQIILCHIINE